jgi:hypothetical protein
VGLVAATPGVIMIAAGFIVAAILAFKWKQIIGYNFPKWAARIDSSNEKRFVRYVTMEYLTGNTWMRARVDENIHAFVVQQAPKPLPRPLGHRPDETYRIWCLVQDLQAEIAPVVVSR